jgi:hypothetical protein
MMSLSYIFPIRSTGYGLLLIGGVLFFIGGLGDRSKIERAPRVCVGGLLIVGLLISYVAVPPHLGDEIIR